MSRHRPDYSWVVELLFILAGIIVWAAGGPMWLAIILLAAGGLVLICTAEGGGDWDFF